jgi:flagellin
MRINTNISAMNIWRQSQGINRDLDRSLERLSSGSRINRASDGAADLAISERLRGRISAIQQGDRNLQAVYAKAGMWDSAIQELVDMAARGYELKSAYDSTNDVSLRSMMAAEWDALSDAATEIIAGLSYNGAALGATETVNVDGSVVMTFTMGSAGALAFTATLGNGLTFFDGLIDDLTEQLAVVGGNMRAIEAQQAVQASAYSAHVMGESAIRDTDIAMESTRLTRAQILSQSNIAMLAQANARPLNLLALLR